MWLAVIYAISLPAVAYLILTAPEGWESPKGFRLGRPDDAASNDVAPVHLSEVA